MAEAPRALPGPARELAEGLAAGTLSLFIGIRIKPFTEELKAR